MLYARRARLRRAPPRRATRYLLLLPRHAAATLFMIRETSPLCRPLPAKIVLPVVYISALLIFRVFRYARCRLLDAIFRRLRCCQSCRHAFHASPCHAVAVFALLLMLLLDYFAILRAAPRLRCQPPPVVD